MPSEIIIIVIELMFLGVNMFLALLKTDFSPRHEPESGQKHIYAREHQLYCYNNDKNNNTNTNNNNYNISLYLPPFTVYSTS